MNKADLRKMYDKWVADCTSVVKEKVPPTMKQTLKKAIKMEVYAKYRPSQYERRKENGGLLDEENMDYEIKVEGNRIKLIMYSTVRREYGSPEYIDSVIVTGKGYQWERSRIYQSQMPRDFYKVAQEIIESEELRIKLKRVLQSKGYTIK